MVSIERSTAASEAAHHGDEAIEARQGMSAVSSGYVRPVRDVVDQWRRVPRDWMPQQPQEVERREAIVGSLPRLL